jgi:hypothetical protein
MKILKQMSTIFVYFRQGRCGEWANCFTLCARALGFETRYYDDEFVDGRIISWSSIDSCTIKLIMYGPKCGRWQIIDGCIAIRVKMYAIDRYCTNEDGANSSHMFWHFRSTKLSTLVGAIRLIIEQCWQDANDVANIDLSHLSE